jgi:hypothetical protein
VSSTSFTGSTAERITNIRLPPRFQGDGGPATFSFGDNLGDVSLRPALPGAHHLRRAHYPRGGRRRVP